MCTTAGVTKAAACVKSGFPVEESATLGLLAKNVCCLSFSEVLSVIFVSTNLYAPKVITPPKQAVSNINPNFFISIFRFDFVESNLLPERG